jgi:hypothetical protein
MLRSRKEVVCREPNVGMTACAANHARPCNLRQETREICTRHHGRCSCLLGGTGVRTTDRSSEVPDYGMPGSVAETEPEARQVPLPLRKERNEAMGLPSNQVADKGATQDTGTPQSMGTGTDQAICRDIPSVSSRDHRSGKSELRSNVGLRRRSRQYRGSLRHPASGSRDEDGQRRIGLGNESLDTTAMDDRLHGRQIRERVRSVSLPDLQPYVLTPQNGGSRSA